MASAGRSRGRHQLVSVAIGQSKTPMQHAELLCRLLTRTFRLAVHIGDRVSLDAPASIQPQQSLPWRTLRVEVNDFFGGSRS
jgi:hypothetical protein